MTHPNEDREPDAWGVEGHDGRIAAARATHGEATLVAANMAAAHGWKHARPVVPLYRALPPAPAASAPTDDAVALLADARKCVELANVNGYYDVWLVRCKRVLALAAERAAKGGE